MDFDFIFSGLLTKAVEASKFARHIATKDGQASALFLDGHRELLHDDVFVSIVVIATVSVAEVGNGGNGSPVNKAR